MSAQACYAYPNACPNIVGPFPWAPTIAPPYPYQQPAVFPWPYQQSTGQWSVRTDGKIACEPIATLPERNRRRRLRYSR